MPSPVSLTAVPLSRPEEQLLAAFHKNLRPKELTPGDRFYVDLLQYGEAVGDDVVALLKRDITWTETPSAAYFSGFRGAGKSTQLNRLKAELTSEGWAVVKFSLEELLDVRYPIEVSDLLFAIPAGIASACLAEGWVRDEVANKRIDKRWIDKVTSIRPTGMPTLTVPIDPGAGDTAMEVNLDLFRLEPAYRDKLRRYLRDSEAALLAEANTFIADVIKSVRENWTGPDSWRGFVVIADSLDHASSESDFASVASRCAMSSTSAPTCSRSKTVRWCIAFRHTCGCER